MSDVLYVQHTSGANHAIAGRRLRGLRSEILAGRGGPDVVRLVTAGYVGFVGRDGELWDFEALGDHFREVGR